jgi:hypothetical protein
MKYHSCIILTMLEVHNAADGHPALGDESVVGLLVAWSPTAGI